VPKSKITFVGRNVILGIGWDELFKYKVDKNSPLPTHEPLDKLAEEEENLLFVSPKEIEEKDRKKQIDNTSNAVLTRMI
jgi:hypothetical protein